MDMQKIGSFLKELRKERNMTQEQLGEKIGVTNKTIFRWETGNYMPPVESLILLSDIYGISINELLAGEYVENDKIKEVADENITKVLEELEKDYQKFENKMILLLGITTVLVIAIMNLLPLDSLKNVIIFIMVIAMAMISNTLNLVAIVVKKENTNRKKIIIAY